MTVIGWIQILLYCAIIVAIVPVLGGYMTRVFSGERTLLSPVLRVAGKDTPVPYAKELEDHHLPSAADITEAVRTVAK